MEAHGTGTGDDATTVATGISDDIIHRLQDLMVGTDDAVQTRAAAASSSSKGPARSKTMAAKLDSLRRRRLLLRPASVASITDGLQNLAVGAAASRVRPTAHELIGRLLLPKIAGQQPLPRAAGFAFVHDADVYADAPDHLAATHAPAPPGRAGARPVWYFFSPLHYQQHRDRRTPCRLVGGSGAWKAAAGRRTLAEEGAAASWYVRNLLYLEFRQGKSPASRLTEWRMREYGIIQEEEPLVLCEVYRSGAGRRPRKHE